MKKLFDLKGSFINSLGVSIVEPESTLASGLLLGAKNSLPKSVSDDLRNAGIIHIVVLSGYNITIVADSLMKVLGFLPRIISFSFGIISVLLFALMTGASATVVRASIMSLVLILARFSNRDYLAMRALVLAGFVMVVHNPSILVFDFSFQLSFLASIGLVLLSGRFSSHLKFVTNRFSIREIVSSTLSTQVFVLPFLIYSTGKLSLWGFLSNVLVLPIIPLTMFLSLISGLVGYVGGIFSYLIGGIAYLFLKYIFVIASFFGNLDFGIFDITNISFKTLFIFYLILLFFIFFKRK
jgi:competence protein ComEC